MFVFKTLVLLHKGPKCIAGKAFLRVAKEDIGAVSGLNSSYVHGAVQQIAGSNRLRRTSIYLEGRSFRPEAVGVAIWEGYTSGTLTLHIYEEKMLRISWWAASWTYRKVL